MAAGASNRFNPGGLRGVRKPPTTEEWEKFSDYEKDQKRGEEWMNRVYGWDINADADTLPKSRWIPDKVLGKGIAVFKKGFIEPQGNVRHERIVVRQASNPEAKARLQNGANILDHIRGLTGYDADHIIQSHGGYEEDLGTGTDDTFDPAYVHEFAPETVGRTYTTYYEQGNLNQWLENNFGEQYLSENDLWSVMGCMAKICMRLEHGDSSRANYESREQYKSVVHLDIRPESIFCTMDNDKRQHSNGTRFLLGKFEKAAVVPSDPMDKIWMFRVRGRADPKWATPEQKYPGMEERSIGTSCNIFGIGALLYYMITGRELGDSAWNIGISDSPTDQGLKLYFGADLVTEPIATQQEYSKTLVRTILQCLSYHPRDRIDAKELRALSKKALNLVDRQRMPGEVRYNPGDPAVILEPQEELEPNDYTPSDLSLKLYTPPADQPETLRARADKWLKRFFLFPDSARSQQAREKQRLEYERQVEIQRQAEAAEVVRKQVLADIEIAEAEEIRLQLEEEEEEDRRIAKQRADKRAKIAAEMVRKRAAAGGKEEKQTLLPQPARKRDRSPEIVEDRSRKRPRPASPVGANTPDIAAAQEVGAQPMDVDSNKDKDIPPPGDTDKEKEKQEKGKQEKEKQEKEKQEKEKQEKDKQEKDKQEKDKQEKDKAEEEERKQEERRDRLRWDEIIERREQDQEREEHAKERARENAILKAERENPRLNPKIAIHPNDQIDYKGSEYLVKDLSRLRPPFPWKDYAWWNGHLYLKGDLPDAATKYYKDLKEEGIELVAHSGTIEETRLELESVSMMNRRFDRKQRGEDGHLGLTNPPLGGAARGLNNNQELPRTRKPRDALKGLSVYSPEYSKFYNSMGPGDVSDDSDDSVQEVPPPPANARSRTPPREPRYMVLLSQKAPKAPKAPKTQTPKAPRVSKTPKDKPVAWFCPYCNEKDGGYVQKQSCASHIASKHKKYKGHPKTTPFVPKGGRKARFPAGYADFLDDEA